MINLFESLSGTLFSPSPKLLKSDDPVKKSIASHSCDISAGARLDSRLRINGRAARHSL
ncbi:MAG TPA: hypothetical protein PKX74_17700 [Leptospiraceae bacterium]|nr:hypothetical protein [Leptospiraceae bacterium]